MSEDTRAALNSDYVKLVLGGNEIRYFTTFSIKQSLFRQPGEFEMKLGRGSSNSNLTQNEIDKKQGPTVAGLIELAKPNTTCQVFINDCLRMTGRVDGIHAAVQGGSASELSIFGRDALAPLHDAHIAVEKSFNNATYKSLLADVLKEVGLGDMEIVANGNADRQVKAGVPIHTLQPIRTIDEILATFDKDDFGKTSTSSATSSTLQTKAGQRWMEYLRKQFDRAGLFLWSTADGKVVLSAPNTNLAPTYRIYRKRGQTRNDVNVVRADFRIDTRSRYSYGIVYGKGGGKKNGRLKSKGDSQDREMTDDFGFNEHRAIVIRDTYCQTPAQAAFLAQRKLAEGRRHGWQLTYTMAGLSTPAINGGRAIWTPDTMVEVIDEEFGIDSNFPGGNLFWIEAVDFGRDPRTTSTLHLMRPADLAFGTPDFENATVQGNGVQTGLDSATEATKDRHPRVTGGVARKVVQKKKGAHTYFLIDPEGENGVAVRSDNGEPVF